jgi:endo-1,4-beta-xylanase
MDTARLITVALFLPLIAAAPAPTVPPKPAAPTTNYSNYVERWLTPPKKPNPLLAHKSYHSAAMNTAVGYHIYLPPGYDDAASKDKRYPVIYWLHGLNQSESSNWFPPEILDKAERTAAIPPTIVVFASGGGRAFYVDSADGKLLSETTVIKELVPHIDATYRTIAKREARAIQGMSMGGWGALRLAMAHPDLFSSVAAFAPSLRTPDNLAKTYPDILNRMFGGDAQRFWAAHPLKLARDNADTLRKDMPIAFYCGTWDHLLEGSQNMHALLTELKVDHTYVEVPEAEHSMAPLAAAIKDSSLVFAAKHFTLAPAPSGPSAASGEKSGVPGR